MDHCHYDKTHRIYCTRIKAIAKRYLGDGRSEPLISLINGVTYYKVGHNSSHEFFLGTDAEGNIFRRSYGENGWDEETGVISYSETVTQIASLEEAGYMGHD
jgi:hypothetical protein